MQVYPKVTPMVIYNSYTLYAGVWRVQNKNSGYYLFYFNNNSGAKPLSHRFSTLSEAINAIGAVRSNFTGFTYFTVYSSCELPVEQLIDLLSKISKST